MLDAPVSQKPVEWVMSLFGESVMNESNHKSGNESASHMNMSDGWYESLRKVVSLRISVIWGSYMNYSNQSHSHCEDEWVRRSAVGDEQNGCLFCLSFQTHLPNIKVHAYFAPVTPPPSVGGSRQRFCRCCILLWCHNLHLLNLGWPLIVQ